MPISARVLEQFLDVGFILREDVIKIQHKMKSTREKWRSSEPPCAASKRDIWQTT